MAKAETAFARQPELHDTTIGWRFVNDRIARAYGTESMPETAENLAAEHQIPRLAQDAFALRSQARYDPDWHARDIVRVALRKGDTVVSTDEHPAPPALKNWPCSPPRSAPGEPSPPATPPASTTAPPR